MNYETIKSFILFVLVGISFLLSFILWTYQPKYDLLYDTSYVNEVDVGGSEKTKNELIEPGRIIFHKDEQISGFKKPTERQRFFKELASWVLYGYKETEAEGKPSSDRMVEIVFPSNIPGDVITNLFTFHDDVSGPTWDFDRVYITLDNDQQTSELIIISADNQRQISATIEKLETYYYLLSNIEDETEITQPFTTFDFGAETIYLPQEKTELAKKTFIASTIEPESFVNALFASPSVVTPNANETYFTDGQRGMKIVQDGRRLEYINPLQTSSNNVETIDLIDKSMNQINEHKGWTNNFLFERVDLTANQINYRMYYEGYPTFDGYHLTTIEQMWRDQELYKYNRPLVSVGNLLNSAEKTLPSGEEVVEKIANSNVLEHQNIEDIRIGYTMQYVEDAYSLTLDPEWYILYDGNWLSYDSVDFKGTATKKGGD